MMFMFLLGVALILFGFMILEDNPIFALVIAGVGIGFLECM